MATRGEVARREATALTRVLTAVKGMSAELGERVELEAVPPRKHAQYTAITLETIAAALERVELILSKRKGNTLTAFDVERIARYENALAIAKNGGTKQAIIDELGGALKEDKA
jgi:hypothetical protein